MQVKIYYSLVRLWKPNKHSHNIISIKQIYYFVLPSLPSTDYMLCFNFNKSIYPYKNFIIFYSFTYTYIFELWCSEGCCKKVNQKIKWFSNLFNVFWLFYWHDKSFLWVSKRYLHITHSPFFVSVRNKMKIELKLI